MSQRSADMNTNLYSKIFILFLFLLCFLSLKSKQNLEIALSAQSDAKYVISLKFSSEDEIVLYNWRESLYPVLDRILFISAVSYEGTPLKVRSTQKVIPKIYHPKDLIRFKGNYSFNKLSLEILDSNGMAYDGCFELVAKYNTLKLSKKNIGELSKLSIESNTIKICSKVVDAKNLDERRVGKYSIIK